MVAQKTEQGFTIIELLVTIAVVGIMVPTLAGFVNTLNRFNDRARDLTLVNSLAENKIEGLRSIGYSGISNGTTSFVSELPASIGSPRTATYVVTTPNTGIKQVDLTITFNDHGSTQSVTYRTYIGELGVGQY
jgi:prepilin-type N-terminal cleavage/methylation domain-containing protein